MLSIICSFSLRSISDMKKILALIKIFSFLWLVSQAQERQVIYVDINGMQVTSIDSAYVIREIDKPEKGSLFNFNDFYKSNRKLKLGGAGYFYNNALKFHGNFTTYDIDGFKTQELSFEHGENKGVISEYFKSGRLYRRFERIRTYDRYAFDRSFAEVNEVPNYGYYLFKVNHLADTLGNVVINNGKGYLVEKLNYLGEDFVEEGNYVGGFREGSWKGKNLSGTKSYQDLKYGVVVIDGKERKYTELFTAPDYKFTNNHIVHLYLADIGFYKKYVLGYKKADRGDYWVVVTLNINENGYVDHVSFEKDISNKKVKEDIAKTLLGMPKWKPAKLRGINTSAKYSCAIPFFQSMQ